MGPTNPAHPTSPVERELSGKKLRQGHLAPGRLASPLCWNLKSPLSRSARGVRWAGENDMWQEPRALPEARAGTREGAGAAAAQEGPLPAHAGSKPRPSRRALSPHPPAPNPIRAWHRLSNRLTNPAPPIAGRPGRGLSYQASLRGPSSKVIETLPSRRARPCLQGLRGVPRGATQCSLLWNGGASNEICVCPRKSYYSTFTPLHTTTP